MHEFLNIVLSKDVERMERSRAITVVSIEPSFNRLSDESKVSAIHEIDRSASGATNRGACNAGATCALSKKP